MAELLTRDEMLQRAAMLGAGDISPRTLRFWETTGALPGSSYRGARNCTLYPEWYPWAILIVRLEQLRGASIAEIARMPRFLLVGAAKTGMCLAREVA